uniref:Uncharacterized protein n=1 Tax=Anguilla anguilla TaxID=7936 RepID=A0A0E9SC71_ANGAN
MSNELRIVERPKYVLVLFSHAKCNQLRKTDRHSVHTSFFKVFQLFDSQHNIYGSK